MKMAPEKSAEKLGEMVAETVAETAAEMVQRRRQRWHSNGCSYRCSHGCSNRSSNGCHSNGRNCVRLFDPNDPLSSDDNENIAATLRMAVRNDLVQLAYQPIQNMRTGRVEAVESLMRLKMVDGTPLSPANFLSCAMLPCNSQTRNVPASLVDC